MPNIYSGTDDGWIAAEDTTFAGARDRVTGTSSDSTSTRDSFSVRASLTPGRPAPTYYITRSFFYFDTSSVVYTPASAEMKFFGNVNGAADLKIVKSTQGVGVGLATSDFDSITGWVAGADNTSNVTVYDLATTTTWSTSGFNTIPLNATALQDMAGEDTLKCCLIELDHDLRNDGTGMNTTNYSGLWYADAIGTLKDPRISYTETVDNAVFFGANF